MFAGRQRPILHVRLVSRVTVSLVTRLDAGLVTLVTAGSVGEVQAGNMGGFHHAAGEIQRESRRVLG